MTDARERKADELEAAGELELAEQVRAGRCACGCRALVASRSGRTLFVDGTHRQRVYRRRLEAAAAAAGIPARLSLERVNATGPTSDRHRDAQNGAAAPQTRKPSKRRASRPGVSVYFPRLEVAELVLAVLEGAGPGDLTDDERAAAARGDGPSLWDLEQLRREAIEVSADAVEALERAIDRRRRRDP